MNRKLLDGIMHQDDVVKVMFFDATIKDFGNSSLKMYFSHANSNFNWNFYPFICAGLLSMIVTKGNCKLFAIMQNLEISFLIPLVFC